MLEFFDTLLDKKRASRLSKCVDTGVEFVEVVSVDTGVEVSSGVGQCRAVSGGSVGVSIQGSRSPYMGDTYSHERPLRKQRSNSSAPFLSISYRAEQRSAPFLSSQQMIS